MSDVLESLGVDPTDLEWQDLSLCGGQEINMFFDDYESDENFARAIVDDMCLSCPVMPFCAKAGVEGGEWGVWGGIYLTSGKPDTNRNSHKTPEVWKQIERRIKSVH